MNLRKSLFFHIFIEKSKKIKTKFKNIEDEFIKYLQAYQKIKIYVVQTIELDLSIILLYYSAICNIEFKNSSVNMLYNPQKPKLLLLLGEVRVPPPPGNHGKYPGKYNFLVSHGLFSQETQETTENLKFLFIKFIFFLFFLHYI